MRKIVVNSTPLIALNNIGNLDVKVLLDELINAGMYIDTKLYSKVLEIAGEDS